MLTRPLQLLVEQASGLHLSAPTLMHAARERMRARAVTALADYMPLLEAEAGELTDLLELLVVPETWLFRDPGAFVAASEFARQRHALQNSPVRILSVPCATGEEPYSLAMAMLDHGMTAGQFIIEAVDISSAALKRARAALFRPNAFRSADLEFRERYFTPCMDGELLHPQVRQLVRFTQGNLLSLDARLQAQPFDIIFCRNLLIYFSEQTQHRTVAILENLLADDGLLFSGHAEMPVFTAHGFATAHLPRAFAVRKRRAGLLRAESVAHQNDAGRGCGPSRTQNPWNGPVVSVSPAPEPGQPLPADVAHAMDTGRWPEATSDAASQALPGACNDTSLAGARALADAGQLPAAIRQLEECLALAPDSAGAYAMLGAIHLARDALPEARLCLQRALYLDPGNYDAMCQLAIVLDIEGNAVAASRLRTRAARVAERQAKVAAPERGHYPMAGMLSKARR